MKKRSRQPSNRSVELGDIPRTAKIILALGLLALYVFSAPWSERGHVSDVRATTIPAWHFVETGSWDLSAFEDQSDFFVDTERGVRSNRTPGIIAFATIGYGLTNPITDGFFDWPGTLVAVLTSWLSVLFVAASADRLRKGLWVMALVLFGVGTATWVVSSDQLWPHGPAQLAVAVAVWFLIRGRELSAGLAFAIGVLVRPPVVVLGVGIAVVKALRDRSWRPILGVGGPTVAAGSIYLLYSRLVFGSWNPTAAYEAVGGFYGVEGPIHWLGNTIEAFFGPQHGIFVWSAWLAICVIGVAVRRFDVPAWVRFTPLIAAAYVVVHSALEVASGALPYNYRYPLEAITLATPYLVVAIPFVLSNSRSRVGLVLAGAFSVLAQGAFVFVARCWESDQTGQILCSLLG